MVFYCFVMRGSKRKMKDEKDGEVDERVYLVTPPRAPRAPSFLLLSRGMLIVLRTFLFVSFQFCFVSFEREILFDRDGNDNGKGGKGLLYSSHIYVA